MPSVYMFGAALARPEDVPDIRENALLLRAPGQRKAHWHADQDSRHDKVIAAIAELPIESIVVVRVVNRGEDDERRRRKCLERFA